MKKEYKLKSYDFSNLREKTVFDFTDDVKLLKRALERSDIEPRDKYVKLVTPIGICVEIARFAEYIDNKEFIQQVYTQLELELNQAFNE